MGKVAVALLNTSMKTWSTRVSVEACVNEATFSTVAPGGTMTGWKCVSVTRGSLT